ncbi:MAG: hypothetical protein QOH12_611 [Solirubrobacteraceae bacterium]|nr:hypothetical protein [Solirubrobacteraceae bacterium]
MSAGRRSRWVRFKERVVLMIAAVLGATGLRRPGRRDPGGLARSGDGEPDGESVNDLQLPGMDEGLRKYVDAGERWDAMHEPRRTKRRFVIFGSRPGPLPSFTGLVEPAAPGKVGVCCSGGGIRSAAFNLGALQELQESSELQRAAYLAAVSGGAYIAAAFSMVAKVWPGTGRPDHVDDDGYDDSDPLLLARCKPFSPGSPEEQYLRNRSSYMAPDGNSKVFLAYRIVLGLLFNLVFLSLPLIVLGLVVGEFLFRPNLQGIVHGCQSQRGSTDPGCAKHILFNHILLWWWVAPAGVLGLSFGLAAWSMLRRTSARREQFLETWSVRLLQFGLGLGFVLVAVPAILEGLHRGKSPYATAGYGAAGGAGGLAALVAGVVGLLRQGFATPKKALEELTAAQKRLRGLSAKLRLVVAYFAGAVIGPLLLAGVFVAAVDVALVNSVRGVNRGVVAGAAGATVLFAVLYVLADLTSWSLHPYYKRRLSSAFALKRIHSNDLTRAERDRFEADPPREPPDPEAIGIAIERDFDTLVKLSATAVTGRPWPTLLVCAAANVSDTGATPPGRHVTSFTFSPHTIGGPLVGATSTADFEDRWTEKEGWAKRLREAWTRLVKRKAGDAGKNDAPRVPRTRSRTNDFSLPAAVAMSGAAISPSMGKITRRSFTFLLALANIRLGVWVPNPRFVMGAKSLGRFGRPRPVYLLKELLGRNHVGDRYLYVTDGGHYENLGLVELLRRGCTEIYCFDASGGEGFENLGDAVALARSELGVHIPIDPGILFPDGVTDLAETNAVRVDFNYPAERAGEKGEPAILVYARNVLTAGAPWDAQAYHRIDPNFPHDSTSDQLYTDQKFEGYRVLGELAAGRAVKLMRRA